MLRLIPFVVAVCLLSASEAQVGDHSEPSRSSCLSAGYMIPDRDNLCFVWFCARANSAPIKKLCPKGVRVPSWWEGGTLNMCYVVNILKHNGEPICLRCDVEDQRIDENCANNQCDDECTCLDTEHTYRCVCPGIPAVFRGEGFTPIPDHCDINSCENGGTCQNQWDGFFCFCPNGYTGHRCDIPICDWHPCLNGGTCLVDDVGYHCECTDCFTGACCTERVTGVQCSVGCPPCSGGENCDIPLDTCECLPNLCIPSDGCENTERGPICPPPVSTCSKPCRTGPKCELETDDCDCNDDCLENSICKNEETSDRGVTHICECKVCYNSEPNCQLEDNCVCNNRCSGFQVCQNITGGGTVCEDPCVGDEITITRPDGSKGCDCPECTGNRQGERGCSLSLSHLCNCNNPCPEDRPVCMDGEPGGVPTCDKIPPTAGNSFTVVFEENNTERPLSQIPLELYFTPSLPNDGTRRVNIQSAGLQRTDKCYFNMNFTVPENTVYRLPIQRCMRHNGTGLAELAIRAVEVNNKSMIVYGINKDRYTADGFLAIPDAMAGTKYQTASYAPAHIATQFAVVALNDDTEVRMTMADDNDLQAPYNTAGSSYTVTMKAFETYQVQARCRGPYASIDPKDQCSRDLSGTVIQSNKPIHVFSGNVRTFVQAGEATSRDHLIEQMVPINRWGTMFAFVTIPGRTFGEVISINSIQGMRTRVRLYSVSANGGQEVQTFNLPLSNGRTNSFIEVRSGARYYIESDKPLMVLQLTKSRATAKFGQTPEAIHDPALITVPPVQQFTNNFFVSTPEFTGGSTYDPQPYNESMILVVMARGTERDLRLDGRALRADEMLLPFDDIPNSNLVGGAFRIEHGSHLINSASRTNFQCLIYGSDDRESYGFPVAMNLATLVDDSSL